MNHVSFIINISVWLLDGLEFQMKLQRWQKKKTKL